jgi:hypothetical protein
MAQRRYPQDQNLNLFAAIGMCQVRRVERAVEEHLTGQAWQPEPRCIVWSFARGMWASLRQHSMAPPGVATDRSFGQNRMSWLHCVGRRVR